jgi:hypothetical protein
MALSADWQKTDENLRFSHGRVSFLLGFVG